MRCPETPNNPPPVEYKTLPDGSRTIKISGWLHNAVIVVEETKTQTKGANNGK